MEETDLPHQPLEIQVGVWLRKRGYKLVAAESCTGGLIGHRLTDVPGSSDYFMGSLVTYAYEAKQVWLGVSSETLARFGAVSEEVVLDMARGARRSLSDIIPIDRLVGISVSGIAGPGGGTPAKPVGLVWIGLSAPDFERAWRCHWQGTRAENKEQSVDQALLYLLQYLRGEVS